MTLYRVLFFASATEFPQQPVSPLMTRTWITARIVDQKSPTVVVRYDIVFWVEVELSSHGILCQGMMDGSARQRDTEVGRMSAHTATYTAAHTATHIATHTATHAATHAATHSRRYRRLSAQYTLLQQLRLMQQDVFSIHRVATTEIVAIRCQMVLHHDQ